MKKLVAIILASLVLSFAFAGCGGKGEILKSPSSAAEDSTAGTYANDTKVTSTLAEEESKAEGNTDTGSQSGNAPVQENDDLEIITYVSAQDPQPEGGNDTSDSDNEPLTETLSEAATEANTEDSEEETTEREVIILPFVPAE